MQQHSDPLQRHYDPSKDNLPIDELLARPRLPRSPFEHDQNKAFATLTQIIKPVVKSEEERAADFEQEKAKVRALGEDVAKMKVEKEGEQGSSRKSMFAGFRRWSD
jgi:hypothetical protein